MKFVTVALFASLVVLSSLNGYHAGEPASADSSSSASSSSNSGSGGASASSSAHSTGGSASAIAVATSESFSKAKSVVVAEVRRLFIRVRELQSKRCIDIHESIDIFIERIGLAFAKALSEAYSDVYVEGPGSACASSSASGRASARSLVRVIASAIIAIKSEITFAKAEAYVEVYFGVYVDAFSDAWSSACISGPGFAFALQTSVAKAISRPIATVLVWVAAGIDCSGKTGFAKAVGEGFADAENSVETSTTSDTAVDGDGNADADGTASASAHKARPCTGLHRKCCNPQLKERCLCKIGSKSRCNLHRSAPGSKLWMGPDNKPFCGC